MGNRGKRIEMKVLNINAKIDSGSVGRIVTNIYNGVWKSGNICKVAYARGSTGKVKEKDTIKIGTKVDVLYHYMMSSFFGSTATYSKRATKQLIEKIEMFHPDIIHMHGNYGYYINIKVLFEYLSRKEIPVVITLHSCWDFTGHCCYFDSAGCSQWMEGCYKCCQKREYPKSYVFENVKKNYLLKKSLFSQLDNCTVVAPCQWMNNIAKKSFINKHKIVTIYNGIDLNTFKPVTDNDLNLDFDKITILCVANAWDRRKGLDDVIGLANAIGNEGQVIIVGIDKKRQKNLPNNAIAIERTKNTKELACLYSNADILFNPTNDDNYPTVNLESIACHTPVVTYNTGGSVEVLKDGKYGISVEKNDYNEVIKYAKKIHFKEIDLDFSDLSFLDESRMVEEYLSLYNSLLEA